MKAAALIGPVTAWRSKASSPVVFVPTMGALHEGHASLIRRARRLADASGKKGNVVVSIFVNPKQFGPKEDLSKYPRPFAEDRALCKREGVDLLFHPAAGEMYASDSSVSVTESYLSSGLCGASRPGHFDGVCTVVSMLFNMIRPDIATFGEKDWQQLAVIRRMVRDLKIPVKIQGHPTVREEDGLALSSRNRLLLPESRLVAPRIYQALLASAMEAEAGDLSVSRVRQGLKKDLAAIPGAEIDYVQIVDEVTLVPLEKLTPQVKARALVAVRFGSVGTGSVRLIDNISLPFRS
jgi:pantoate--beta-alanine ligase